MTSESAATLRHQFPSLTSEHSDSCAFYGIRSSPDLSAELTERGHARCQVRPDATVGLTSENGYSRKSILARKDGLRIPRRSSHFDWRRSIQRRGPSRRGAVEEERRQRTGVSRQKKAHATHLRRPSIVEMPQGLSTASQS